MEYEQMLNDAYKNVDVSEGCDRFEVLKVKGHHEGVRTVVSNFGQIVVCLRRRPEHVMKFLSKELASSVEMRGGGLILSRRLSSQGINDKIERYVKRFVICPKCGKPDTELEVGTRVFLKCLACGSMQEVHKI